MRRDKALLPYRGGLLVESVARAVERAAGSAVLVGDPAIYAGLAIRTIPDIYPGQGPLGGILTALAHTASEWNLVAACDMPDLSAVFLSALLDEAAAADADVFIPRGPSGLPEPLCAVYHRRARQVLSAAFAGGIRKVTAAFDGLRVASWPVSDEFLQNVNTPEDWAAYGAK